MLDKAKAALAYVCEAITDVAVVAVMAVAIAMPAVLCVHLLCWWIGTRL